MSDRTVDTAANLGRLFFLPQPQFFALLAVILLANGCLLLLLTPFWPLGLLNGCLGGVCTAYFFSTASTFAKCEAPHFVPAIISVGLSTFMGSNPTFSKLIVLSMVFIFGQLGTRWFIHSQQQKR